MVRLLPSVYGLGGARLDRNAWRRAALLFVPGSVLSHLDGLDLWGYPVPAAVLRGAPVHVSRGSGAGVRPHAQVCVHRRRDFAAMPKFLIGRHDLPVVSPEQAIIESWPLLPELDRRAPTILAMRDRGMKPEQLLATIDAQPRARGATQMRELIGLVTEGCHSELEIWGHAHVFGHPQLRGAKAQHRISVDGRTLWLDRYFEEEMVDAELDGAAYHGRPDQRERDIKRDAALARRGILTVRYSHLRLHQEPDVVVAELLDILAKRRRQLGLR